MAETGGLGRRNRHQRYYDLQYSTMQVRHCVQGSDAVKKRNELYLPMPSGMRNLRLGSTETNDASGYFGYEIDIKYVPWYHKNPAYRSYLQRARFPDVTALIMFGLIGVATKNEPVMELTPSTAQLEDIATTDGMDLSQMCSYATKEILQAGKVCFVLDVKDLSLIHI